MTKRYDPAFPAPHGSSFIGMSLRDYFAALALPALLHANETHWTAQDCDMTFAEMAEVAYQIADAMLKAREES